MNWVRGALFNLVFFAGSALLALILVLALPLPRSVMRAGGRVWAWGVNTALRHIVGVTIEIRGSVPRGACIVASKHQSAWEAVAFLGLLPDACYVLKHELAMVPVLGWIMRKNRQIVVDRKGGAGALRAMLGDGEKALAEGRQVVIFPEGTRVAAGARGTYQPGTAALYRHLGVAVVPVALNSGLVWGRRSTAKRPGRIIMAFLEPIAPGIERRAFLATLEERIESMTEALVREVSPTRDAPNQPAAA